MAKQIGKGCKACGYKGYFVEDFNDPRDNAGHGQNEYPCDLCDSGGIVNAWERYRKVLTEAQQKRVKQRVIDGWTLEKAIQNEGIMVLRWYREVDDIVELFENGTLEVGEKTAKDTIIAGEYIAEGDAVYLDENSGTYKKVAGGFIPRPKHDSQNQNGEISGSEPHG